MTKSVEKAANFDRKKGNHNKCMQLIVAKLKHFDLFKIMDTVLERINRGEFELVFTQNLLAKYGLIKDA